MKFKRELAPILFILFLAGIKYGYQAFVLNPFEIDQEFLSLEAWNFLKQGNATLIGAHTSVGGMYIGPGYTYFIYLVMWLTKLNPYTINTLSMVWATSTAVILYLIGKKIYSREVGLVAGILAATSIAYLNITEVPPLVIPLGLVSLLMFYCLSQLKANRTMLFWSWFLAMIAIHLHFTGLYLILIFFLWLALTRTPITERNLIIGIIMTLISFSPLIAFDLRHNFLNSRNFITFLLTTNGLKVILWSVQRSFFLALGNLGALFNNFQAYNLYISAAVWVIFVLYFIFTKHRTQHHQLLIIWLIFPIVVNGIYTGELLPYYYIFHQPQIFLVIGLLLERLMHTQVGATAFVTMCLLYTFLNFRHLESRPNQFRLQNKIAAFEIIKKHAGTTNVNLSFTVEYSRRGGLDFLRLYYGFDTLLLESRPTYTLVSPHYLHRLVGDYTFGEYDVILPQETR